MNNDQLSDCSQWFTLLPMILMVNALFAFFSHLSDIHFCTLAWFVHKSDTQ